MYKLLILDIDGTLRDEVYGIPESAKHAIRLCQKNHCSVVICTGRSIGTIQDDVLSLGVDDILQEEVITFNIMVNYFIINLLIKD